MFNNGDVICFLGDSITASGLWPAEVYQTLGKSVDVKCYNCGVSGTTATHAEKYLYSLCLSKNPDKVILMYGVNDINRGVLSASYSGTDGRKLVAEAVTRYAEKMEYLVSSIIDFDAELILCTAPPYDEYNESAIENLECDYALEECAETVRALARKYNCHLVDFRANMLPLMTTHHPIGADRVHPNQHGYHMMAQIFMKECSIIDECNFEEPFVLEEWNAKRREVEVELKKLDHVDYNRYLFKSIELGWGVPEKLNACHDLLENSKAATPFMRETAQAYIDKAAKRDELISELVKLTVYPSKAK